MTTPRLRLPGPVHHLFHLGRSAAAWPVSSQQGARRNAMVAATEIRHRRQEQLEVEAFLSALTARRAPATAPTLEAAAAASP